jgi:hypothetical protein
VKILPFKAVLKPSAIAVEVVCATAEQARKIPVQQTAYRRIGKSYRAVYLYASEGRIGWPTHRSSTGKLLLARGMLKCRLSDP